LEAQGATADYSDPHVTIAPLVPGHDIGRRKSVSLDAQTIAGYDAVLVATDHRAFDWDLIARNAKVVIDTRNALASRLAGRTHYFKA
jgi:UDP-N-acetyl-D-glucosamine dehydrogenase